MSSQLPRQTDGELAEYDGSLTGDQVFYTNIYLDILWKWIPWTNWAFICCFFNEDIFQGASNAEGSCEDWVSQPRRSWGEFLQFEPIFWHIVCSCFWKSKVQQCEWCRSWRRSWGEFFQFEPIVGRQCHRLTICFLYLIWQMVQSGTIVRRAGLSNCMTYWTSKV